MDWEVMTALDNNCAGGGGGVTGDITRKLRTFTEETDISNTIVLPVKNRPNIIIKTL